MDAPPNQGAVAGMKNLIAKFYDLIWAPSSYHHYRWRRIGVSELAAANFGLILSGGEVIWEMRCENEQL